MATNKDDKTNSKYRFLKEMDGMVSVNPGEGRQYDPDYDRRVRIKKIAKT